MSESQKVQVTLYHRLGAGSYGVGDTFEQARAIAWKEWRAAFGTEAPASTAIDPAPLRTDANLKAARISPLLGRVLSQYQPQADRDEDYDGMMASIFEELECFVRELKTNVQERDIHNAREALRLVVRELLDLDATLVHHQERG